MPNLTVNQQHVLDEILVLIGKQEQLLCHGITAEDPEYIVRAKQIDDLLDKIKYGVQTKAAPPQMV